MSRLMKDLAVDKKRNPAAFTDRFASDEEDGDDEDGDMSDNDIIDRSLYFRLYPRWRLYWLYFIDEELGPGQREYIDLTQMRRDDTNDSRRWPRPQ